MIRNREASFAVVAKFGKNRADEYSKATWFLSGDLPKSKRKLEDPKGGQLRWTEDQNKATVFTSHAEAFSWAHFYFMHSAASHIGVIHL